MITVCAWCPGNGREPALLHDDGKNDDKVSHGLCMPCSDAMVDDALDSLDGDGLDELDVGEDDDFDPLALDEDEEDEEDWDVDFENFDDDDYIRVRSF